MRGEQPLRFVETQGAQRHAVLLRDFSDRQRPIDGDIAQRASLLRTVLRVVSRMPIGDRSGCLACRRAEFHM
jgi:hypothetical protein